MDIEKTLGMLKNENWKKIDLIFEGINITTLLSPVDSIHVNGVCGWICHNMMTNRTSIMLFKFG
jgi:hypothetical protein